MVAILPLTGSDLTKYNNIPTTPKGDNELGDIINALVAGGALYPLYPNRFYLNPSIGVDDSNPLRGSEALPYRTLAALITDRLTPTDQASYEQVKEVVIRGPVTFTEAVTFPTSRLVFYLDNVHINSKLTFNSLDAERFGSTTQPLYKFGTTSPFTTGNNNRAAIGDNTDAIEIVSAGGGDPAPSIVADGISFRGSISGTPFAAATWRFLRCRLRRTGGANFALDYSDGGANGVFLEAQECLFDGGHNIGNFQFVNNCQFQGARIYRQALGETISNYASFGLRSCKFGANPTLDTLDGNLLVMDSSTRRNLEESGFTLTTGELRTVTTATSDHKFGNGSLGAGVTFLTPGFAAGASGGTEIREGVDRQCRIVRITVSARVGGAGSYTFLVLIDGVSSGFGVTLGVGATLAQGTDAVIAPEVTAGQRISVQCTEVGAGTPTDVVVTVGLEN